MIDFTPYPDVPYEFEYDRIFKQLTECEPQVRINTYRDLCKADLFFLMLFGLQYTHMHANPRVAKWCVEQCSMVQRERDNTVDLWARGHYKSTILTVGLTIQDILKDPECTTALLSYTQASSRGFVEEIRRGFEKETLKNWFPDIVHQSKPASGWSAQTGLVVKRKTNRKEPTVSGWGVIEHMPTGIHVDHLVYDDVVTPESVTTAEQIRKTEEAFKLSDNLGTPGGTKRIIGTHYHFADLYTNLNKSGLYKVRKFPCLDDDGNSVLLTDQEVKQKQETQGPYVFSCQMLLSPVQEADQEFRREWVRRWTSLPAQLNKYILVDPAGEPNAANRKQDYTAISVVGIAPGNNIYLLDLYRGQISLREIWKILKQMAVKWNTTRVGYERYGMQRDIHLLTTWQNEQNVFLDIRELGGGTSKNDRIRRLIPSFAAGKFHIPDEPILVEVEPGRSRDIIADFLNDELFKFPYSEHDDMMDSISRIEDREALGVQVPFIGESQAVGVVGGVAGGWS